LPTLGSRGVVDAGPADRVAIDIDEERGLGSARHCSDEARVAAARARVTRRALSDVCVAS